MCYNYLLPPDEERLDEDDPPEDEEPEYELPPEYEPLLLDTELPPL
jgi:hypothetical protein